MPYSTPSASQYIQIKRLQTGINGKASNSKSSNKKGSINHYAYDGYSGFGINRLPPNVLTSNKFLQHANVETPKV